MENRFAAGVMSDLWRTQYLQAADHWAVSACPDSRLTDHLICLRYLSVSAGSGVSIKAHIKYVNVRIIHRADKRCLFQQQLEYLHCSYHSASQTNVPICCL